MSSTAIAPSAGGVRDPRGESSAATAPLETSSVSTGEAPETSIATTVPFAPVA
ncbi:MAG: hypothetical protein IPJ77_19865 [Planctomycetes bacterium]|nr:hypothetical protein [Planctomycetota bacterium]